ncbi:hypothetical protein ACOQFO_09025 [Ureibacillus sp. MALMAid1270]|uniref:hypothetical protein n=1 Tax=Ureibacillus sp. MALMAid1270 TaxID=3411629 RepID=UPI003BA61634
MKKNYLFLFLIIFLSGCSSASLQEAIEKSGGYSKVQILFEEVNDQVVIFHGEDRNAKQIIGLNVYSTGIGNRYEPGTGEHSQPVDIYSDFDTINISRIDHDSKTILWGWLYNYPSAKEFNYTIIGNNGNVIYESTIEVKENGIIYEKLPIDIGEVLRYHFKIYDDEGNIISEK